MAMGQQGSRGGSEHAAWGLPKWPSGGDTMPGARQIKERHKWGEEHADTTNQLNRCGGGCMGMDDPKERHPVTKQPKEGALVRVGVVAMKWKKDMQAGGAGEAKLGRGGRAWQSH